MGQLPRDLGDQQGHVHQALPEPQPAGRLIRRRHSQVSSLLESTVFVQDKIWGISQNS